MEEKGLMQRLQEPAQLLDFNFHWATWSRNSSMPELIACFKGVATAGRGIGYALGDTAASTSNSTLDTTKPAACTCATAELIASSSEPASRSK